jgi:hypothetical protein
VEVEGRFDGDPFEKLFLKVEKEKKLMTVFVETGETVPFYLAKRAFVFEDIEDPTTFILDYQHNMIIFKFLNADGLMRVMKQMPEEVFMAADLNDKDNEDEQPMKVDEPKKAAVNKAKVPPKVSPSSSTSTSTGPKIDHVKGTSVEDILENDFVTTAERKEKIDQMFSLRETGASSGLSSCVPAPKRRKELIENYIRKPKYSVRRVTLICEWINTLKVWPRKLTILSLHREMCNGLLLANVFKYLKSDVEYVNMHEKAMVKKAAVSNLEQVLGHIWRSKSLNNSRIPSAEDIYNGNTSKTAILINELFAVYILRPLYKNALRILSWYHSILKQYQRPLPAYIFDEGDLSGVWPHFQSGTALFCVVFHFFGAGHIKTTQGGTVRVDPFKIAGDPSSICEFRSNLRYVFELLEDLGIDVIWTAEDWISNPDTEFIMFQLSLIFDKLKDNQCTLPPAYGDKPGLTSGSNGEALVIGLVFKDAPANMKFLPKTRKAVRLGHDDDSMPLLPIDSQFIQNINPRFSAGGWLPQGMITVSTAKISQVAVELKESKLYNDKNNWNARTTVNTEKDNYDDASLVNILRTHIKPKQPPYSHQQAASFETSGRFSVHFGLASGVINDSALSERTKKFPEDLSHEINLMVKMLEDEMKAAKTKMKFFEDNLADRYLQLEESAYACTPFEYEVALQELDKERNDVELEKQRLQVFLSFCVTSFLFLFFRIIFQENSHLFVRRRITPKLSRGLQFQN